MGVWGLAIAWAAMAAGDPIAVYPHLLDVRAHPDDARRAVKPPSWEDFGNATQFTTLRGFPMEGNRIVRIEEELDRYTVAHDLGRVIWPSYSAVFAENAGELADAIARRGLWLFDPWGYVPGSGPGDYWQQYTVPQATLDLLEAKLGKRWLGMDVGEQDGRYIGGYADQLAPMTASRFDQYRNFQHHFERMGDDLGHKLATLVSLNYGHYFLKEGTHTCIGAETAQALPNSQVYYAFIRGAGKQYGVPWFGNASVWNRWGWKTYDGTGATNGPTKGTSLNLLERLLYTHIFYNCVFAGFENSWLQGDGLSPIGVIQQSAQRWVREHGSPGVQHTPIAIMLDFFSGWTFPRHLYTPHAYRVWGNLPYEEGDYFTDAVLDMLYPGYADASYFRDERGFLSPTPYGDCADVLLSDAPGWVLAQYPVVVIAGALEITAGLRRRLEDYVAQGGHLVITAGNLMHCPGTLGGFHVGHHESRFGGVVKRYEAGTPVEVWGTHPTEPLPFNTYPIDVPSRAPNCAALAYADDAVLAATNTGGKGRVTVLGSVFGVAHDPSVVPPVANAEEQPLAKPFRMPLHVERMLAVIFRGQMLFDAGPDLNAVTCRKGPGDYTLCITNNALEARPLRIESRCGPIEAIEELPIDRASRNAVGYLPEGHEAAPLGENTADAIAGGSVRIFSVRVREENVVELPKAAPPPNPKGRVLPIGNPALIKDEILRRPDFFQRFDGALVDWRYLRDRETEALRREAGWLQRQGLRLYVDLRPGLNLFPDLRLVDNDPERYAESMAAIARLLEKMPALGAHDLILCLHRQPENSFTWEQTRDSFAAALRAIAARAGGHGITLYLADTLKQPRGLRFLHRLIEESGAANLRLAPSLALEIEHYRNEAPLEADLAASVGLWLAASLSMDFNRKPTGANARMTRLSTSWEEHIAPAPDAPVVFDGVYGDAAAEFHDPYLLTGP